MRVGVGVDSPGFGDGDGVVILVDTLDSEGEFDTEDWEVELDV